MIGSGAPQGHYTGHTGKHAYGPLRPGVRYRVIQAFTDFDRQVHPVGEEWSYLGTAFLPYDDGRSLFVSLDGVGEWHIRMQDRPEEQGPILDNLNAYVVATAPATSSPAQGAD
jgi:hypothetical protein